MKSMVEYIDAAEYLLSALWGGAKASEIRSHIKKRLPDWTTDEQEDLLRLASTLAHCQAEAVNDALWEAESSGRKFAEAARKTSKDIGSYRIREGDKRETKRLAAVIERHFGETLRGEAVPPNGTEDAE